MPTGMSFWGWRASCAAVLTASNPMKAKKIKPAPRSTPDQPNSPNVPVLAGMKGCQLRLCTYRNPTITKTTRTPVLTMTMKLLNPADSRIPSTRIVVMARTMNTAGRLTIAPVACQPATLHPATACATCVAEQNRNGGPASTSGTWTPRRSRKLTNVADQPTPTVAAPMAYSRIRSHPMIQATNSPSVAYEYV